MRTTLALIALTTLTAFAPAPAQALTVFSEDFEASAQGGNVTPTGWTVTDGSVDVVYPGWFGGLCLGSGKCVDLDGSTSNAGVLSRSLTLTAGWTYTLSFDMAGNRRGAGSEAVTVNFGSASTVLSFANSSSTAPWQSYSLSFTPSATGSYALTFANAGGDNQGAMLDNISVTTVPEPASILMLGAGLLTIGALKRRRAA